MVCSAHTAKLVVFLTLPVDPTSPNVVDQQRVLQLMKSAFLDGETSTVIVSMIAEPLSRFEEDGRMDETDTKIVQLILTLFRNLLCIPDSLHSNASAGDHMTRLKVHDHIPPVLNASFWPFPVADADDVLQRTSTNVRFCLSQDDLVQRFFTESVMEVILLIAQVSDVNFVLSVDCVTSTRYVPLRSIHGSALYVCIQHKVAHNIFWYALKGAVGTSPTFLTYYSSRN